MFCVEWSLTQCCSQFVAGPGRHEQDFHFHCYIDRGSGWHLCLPAIRGKNQEGGFTAGADLSASGGSVTCTCSSPPTTGTWSGGRRYLSSRAASLEIFTISSPPIATADPVSPSHASLCGREFRGAS